MPITPRRTLNALQGLTLLLVPHGGQHLARQNAWAGMSRDAALGRDRRDAELALAVALRQATARDATAGDLAAR